jgi:hypothetical protein
MQKKLILTMHRGSIWITYVRDSCNRDVRHFQESRDPEKPPRMPVKPGMMSIEPSMTRYSVKYHNTFKGGVNMRKEFTTIPQGKTN